MHRNGSFLNTSPTISHNFQNVHRYIVTLWNFHVGFDHGLPCRVKKKTWPEGLSREKPRPKAEVFVVTDARHG